MAERSAADQVKALVEAAEQIRAAAERDAERSRESAGRVAERAAVIEQRLDDVHAAVTALRDEVAGLRELAAEVGAAGATDEVDEGLIAEAEAVAARAPDVHEPAEEPEPAAGRRRPEGARLLALKMALDGRPRDETAAYLRENFELAEPDSLLDEVYARAEGRN